MKNTKISILAAASIFLTTSCGKDYLETSPTNQVPADIAFNSIASANATLNGIYRFNFQRTTVVTWNAQNKPGIGGILLGADFMGEDIGISTGNFFTSTGEGNWQIATNSQHQASNYYYRTFYKIIGDANQVIYNINNIVGVESQKNAILAQALTLRAYAYSYLVQFYAKRYDATLASNDQLGIPLVLTPTDIILPRSTVSEVYKVITDDLDKAIALEVTTRSNKSMINSVVAKGLRARVALTMQDYPTAIRYAKEVIDTHQFPLMSEANYQSGFNNAGIGEFIWAMMPTNDQDDTFGSFFAQISYNANTGFVRANPKRINSALYEKISATDVRKKMWEPVPTEQNFPLPTDAFAREAYMSRKFSVKSLGTSLGDVSLMRSSELYLILAEAFASGSQANYSLAQDALFELVSARDAKAVKSTKVGNELLNEIWINRRVELWGEGFRYFDLKRLKQPLDRTVANVPNYASSSVDNWILVPADSKDWQFKIPLDEMNANPLMVQNN